MDLSRYGWHVQHAWDLWWLDTLAWRRQLDDFCKGHLGGGEETEFREAHPPPYYQHYLAAVCRDIREARDREETAA